MKMHVFWLLFSFSIYVCFSVGIQFTGPPEINSNNDLANLIEIETENYHSEKIGGFLFHTYISNKKNSCNSFA